MNSETLRQSFLDFFHEKEHSIVPSASLLPTAPNLLFTNAGMNPFVPYFLGEQAAAASTLPGAVPARDTRAADTQKCIRAGGKHNDLEDVGFDTYHHTFFEMLGNWSFGDYFKKEAIAWAWELLTERWGFPKERLYATVYKPSEGDPADFDQEAYDLWKAIFEKAGLDPAVHIVNGNKKDNFWMMGETGPCGPCSEIHIDLTPEGDSRGTLVNADSPQCIEIWNLVFIQFNAGADGSFRPLAAKHVDTGMGFERVAGILATTNNFTDFSKPPSNYDSDLFTDLFADIEKLSGRTYGYTLPANPEKLSEQELNDVVFRILADHIRTLAFSIADGILPGNDGRNYVLRRILRRAVMWGKRLNLPSGFFTKLVAPLVAKMGAFFPELLAQRTVIEKVIANEESAFEKTLNKGLEELGSIVAAAQLLWLQTNDPNHNSEGAHKREDIQKNYQDHLDVNEFEPARIRGEDAFTLYDTYGFPLDLTQLIARERGLTVDVAGFEKHMNAQRERARAAQKKSVIEVREGENEAATPFLGYEQDALSHNLATVHQSVEADGKHFLIFDKTPFYAEMGGQLGDSGFADADGNRIQILNTIKDASGRFLHEIESRKMAHTLTGKTVTLSVDTERRAAIERHHTATHMLHWALREVLGTHVKQAGSYVGTERLRFDFSHYESVNSAQITEIERLVNERVLLNEPVRWYEVPMREKPEDVVAFFGDKYGDEVRIVEIGGSLNLTPERKANGATTYRAALAERVPGYSAELCGGTHVRATGEIGLFKIVNESAVAAGTRRIEAVAGSAAYALACSRFAKLEALSRVLKCPLDTLDERVESLLAERNSLDKELRALQQQGSAATAKDLAAEPITHAGAKWVVAEVQAVNPNDLRGMAVQISQKLDEALVVILGARFEKKVSILALCNEEAVSAGHQAGALVRDLAGKLGGKGGGKPDFAMGGAADNGSLSQVLDEQRTALKG